MLLPNLWEESCVKSLLCLCRDQRLTPSPTGCVNRPILSLLCPGGLSASPGEPVTHLSLNHSCI